MNRALFIAVALIASGLSAQAADLKFGVVDMSKAFSEYYKTKVLAERFKANVDKAQTEMNLRWGKYRSKMENMQKLQKDASDPIISPDSRAKKAADFTEAGKELRVMEQDIGAEQNRRTNQLKQEDIQIRKGIYDEILVVVKDKAKSSGYDFIFDKSGMSLSTVPILIYYKDAVDMTDEIVVELNKNAPAADAAKPADPAATDAPKQKK
jgi:outer membrane protein